MGGNITWDCLSNGKYRFSMTIYADCATYPRHSYTNLTLDIAGSTFPTTKNGSQIASIILRPDSNRWLNESNGALLSECSGDYGTPLGCTTSDEGSLIRYFYISDPINLYGVPARTGWEFSWSSGCCRDNGYENVKTNLTGLRLQSIMYSNANKDSTNICFDSSPRFVDQLLNACRGDLTQFNYNTTDPDIDSLVYRWATPMTPGSPPVPLAYKTGFSDSLPLPGIHNDSQNVSVQLNKASGQVSFKVANGAGFRKYATAIRVDTYREGTRIASVFQDFPYHIVHCPNLPNENKNHPPIVRINGKIKNSIVRRVSAGQKVSIPIQIKDEDSTGIGIGLQKITAVPYGTVFSKNRISSIPCSITRARGKNFIAEPCAYLQNKAPFFDNQSTPPSYKLEGIGSITTEFVWQTDCNHIIEETETGELANSQIFTLKIQDDHCPYPAYTTATIQVDVLQPEKLAAPLMKAISVDLEGKITYQWVPPIDTAATFKHYRVQFSATAEGRTPVYSSSLANRLKNYAYQHKDENVFVHVPKPSGGSNILRKLPNRDWYIRMNTHSGCTDSGSVFSLGARIMELDISANGVHPNPPRSSVLLKWNAPSTQANSGIYPYSSNTHYYIWRNDSVDQGGADKLANWYLIGHTTQTQFELASKVCSQNAAFRIESRDTVVSYKSGTSLTAKEYDTFRYSAFSIIDTFLLQGLTADINLKQDTIFTSIEDVDYQWFNCKTGVSNAADTMQWFVPQDTGTYAVVVSLPNCKDTSDCQPYYSVGIEEFSWKSSFELFPNPTDGLINLQFDQIQNDLSIIIRNTQGQIVQRNHFSEVRDIKFSLHQAPGIYFIQLLNTAGETAQMKVVKQ